MGWSPTTIYAGEALFAYVTLGPDLANESSAIRFIDPGKTTVTTAILAAQAQKGLATVKGSHAIAKGGARRDEAKTVTITAATAAPASPSSRGGAGCC
jgi:hypothetical protein